MLRALSSQQDCISLALRAPCVSEASCPNFQPRAHASLTGLTTARATGHGHERLPDVAWPAARSAALWAFCRRIYFGLNKNIFWSQHETNERMVTASRQHLH